MPLPLAGHGVHPSLPIPGTEGFEAAKNLGRPPPTDFHEWGKCFECTCNSHEPLLPADVRGTRRLHDSTSAMHDSKRHEGPKGMREPLAQVAGWHLEKQRHGLPLEQQLFDIHVRTTGQLAPAAKTTSQPTMADARPLHCGRAGGGCGHLTVESPKPQPELGLERDMQLRHRVSGLQRTQHAPRLPQ